MASKSIYIGLDVGGTFLKGACIDDGGHVKTRLHEPIRKESANDLLTQIESAVHTLESQCAAGAVGIGLPGIVDERGTLRSAPNVPVLDGLQVGDEVFRRTGRPAFAQNDANAAALAEAWAGAGRGASNLLFVTLGTGVGGGIVLDGRIWGGHTGYAGEIGHVQVDPGGIPCGCGSWGCVETIAGIGGWVRRAEEARQRRESSLAGRKLDPEVIVQAAREGDAVALEVVDGAAAAVAVGVAACLNLLNLERVVIGGGVAAAGVFLLDRIVEQTRRRLFPHVFDDATFRLALLGSDAGVVGAARVAMLGVRSA